MNKSPLGYRPSEYRPRRERARESLRPLVLKVTSRQINFYFRARESDRVYDLLPVSGAATFHFYNKRDLRARYFGIYSRYFGYRAVFVTPSVRKASRDARDVPELCQDFPWLSLNTSSTRARARPRVVSPLNPLARFRDCRTIADFCARSNNGR